MVESLSGQTIKTQMMAVLANFIGMFESTCDLEFGSRESWQSSHEILTTTRFREYDSIQSELGGLITSVNWQNIDEAHEARVKFLHAIGITEAKNELKASKEKFNTPEETMKARITELQLLELTNK